jgi:hypothetical protein
MWENGDLTMNLFEPLKKPPFTFSGPCHNVFGVSKSLTCVFGRVRTSRKGFLNLLHVCGKTLRALCAWRKRHAVPKMKADIWCVTEGFQAMASEWVTMEI